MEQPPLFGLVRVVAELSAFFGCLVGGFWAIAALKVLQINAWAGFVALLPDAGIIAGSLSALGFTYAFLTAVEALIDIRNARLRPRPGIDGTTKSSRVDMSSLDRPSGITISMQ